MTHWAEKTTLTRALVFWGVFAVLGVFGCTPFPEKPPDDWWLGGPRWAPIGPPGRRPGDACVSIGAKLDDRFNPLGDVDSWGHLVFVCTRIRPAMSRRVVDDATRSPIAGAVVTVESWLGRNPIYKELPATAVETNRHLLKVIEVRTDAQGFWDVSQGGMWMPAVDTPGGLPWVWWSYCVRADGYSPLVVDPWKLWDEDRFDDMISDVALHAATAVVDKPDPTLSECGLPLGPPL